MISCSSHHVGAMAALEQEIVPDSPPAAASAQYRKSLALSLFYKVHTMTCVLHVHVHVHVLGKNDYPVIFKNIIHYMKYDSQYVYCYISSLCCSTTWHALWIKFPLGYSQLPTHM